MTDKHSPLPLSIEKDPGTLLIRVRDANGSHLATFDYSDLGDAELVVTACNYHERLVEMLRRSYGYLNAPKDKAMEVTLFSRHVNTLLAELEVEG